VNLLKGFKVKKEREEKEHRDILYLEGVANSLGVTMHEAELILDKKRAISIEELQHWKDNTTGYTGLYDLFDIRPESIFCHPNGLIERFTRENGEVVVRGFGHEDLEVLREGLKKVREGVNKFAPGSSKPVKLLKNENNTVQFGVFTQRQSFIVTRWTPEENVVRPVETFAFEGSSDSLEGKAALAKALKSAQTRFVLEK